MKKLTLLLLCSMAIITGCDNTPIPEAVEVVASDAPSSDISDAIQQAETSEVEEVILAQPAHNANNSLDWDGTYIGKLPCADCSGINVTLNLNKDGTYILVQSYEGEQEGRFTSEGQFIWNELGNTITLEQQSAPNQYFVGENVLMKLGMNGERITGDLAKHYWLTKQ
ncbi:copper resistance protein NlpE [Vibrio mexicanus]|uniref:copper resistance protein NlpE n=1 Tax=Vibrio mexicanus TaxID=1004326 RepID=UPI00063CDD06|nr:copper resistance protein NlpE [Vibrio mexicanus]